MKLFADDAAIAILDVNPIVFGHSLYISKVHYPTLSDVPDGQLGHIVKNLSRVASALLQAAGCEGFNIIQNNRRCAGQLVPHLHFHIIPRQSGDAVRFNWQAGVFQSEPSRQLAEDVCLALNK